MSKKFETKAIRDQLERSQYLEHSSPLYLTSSFVFEDDEELENLASNKILSEFYEKLIEDLDVKEAKHPDQIFKIKLDGGDKIDSKKMNVAYSIVNAFVNAGMSTDALMLD